MIQRVPRSQRQLKHFARGIRNSPTDAERILWQHLLIPSPLMGPLHNYCHSRAGGRFSGRYVHPGGGANGNLTAKQSLESADIELCKEPSMGEGQGEGNRDGHRFTRQYLINDAIVDFICRGPKLFIELDGGQHDQQ